MFFNSVAVGLSMSNIFYDICRMFQSIQEKQFLYNLYKDIVRVKGLLIMAEIGFISLLSSYMPMKFIARSNYNQIRGLDILIYK